MFSCAMLLELLMGFLHVPYAHVSSFIRVIDERVVDAQKLYFRFAERNIKRLLPPSGFVAARNESGNRSIRQRMIKLTAG